jgi:hypothetical protein
VHVVHVQSAHVTCACTCACTCMCMCSMPCACVHAHVCVCAVHVHVHGVLLHLWVCRIGLGLLRRGTHESRSSTRGGVAATTAAEGVGCASHARTRSKTIPRRSYASMNQRCEMPPNPESYVLAPRSKK